MRVAVVINSKASTSDEALIEGKVRDALFRCDLSFIVPQNLAELAAFAKLETGRADFIMICGGDGTINVTLTAFLQAAGGNPLPPICLVRAGTANDLAAEIGVSRKIDRAARCILEGKIKYIDLIELEADTGEKAVMITNGGVGIPALIADVTNRMRANLRDWSASGGRGGVEFFARQTQKALRRLGAGLYVMMVAEALRQWKGEGWEVEVEVPGHANFVTRASCILISNQPRLGRDMTPAPFTSNDDGLMNVLVCEALNLKDQVRAVLSFRRGTPDRLNLNRSFEVSELRLRSRELGRSLTFFGDGEILLKDVREITIRCQLQRLPVVVRA